MMKLHRRAMLARTAALPALALVTTAPALADIWAPAADPIFTLIEAHRGASLEAMRATWNVGDRFQGEPGYDEVAGRESAAWDAFEDATADFSESPPTTLAGMAALLDYVRAFNNGEIEHNEANYSEAGLWPDDFLEDHLPTLLRAALASMAKA